MIPPNYEEYINGPEWKRIRTERIEEENGICSKCKWALGKQKEVHHNNYDNFGREGFSDTNVMHPKCHDREHGKKNDARSWGR